MPKVEPYIKNETLIWLVGKGKEAGTSASKEAGKILEKVYKEEVKA